ncbi:MAG: serine protease [Proteobacteria bacterium]|nr:serine protease [Pseudomonadota bacterium]
MRRLDVALVFLLLVGVAFSTIGDLRSPQPRRPPPQRPPAATLPSEPPPADRPGTLSPPSDRDVGFEIESTPKESDVSGTAFAIGAGVWMTAEHVTESCGSLFLEADGRLMPVFDLVEHPSADVAVFRTRRSGPHLPLSDRLDAGQTGFHHGFPSGAPGDVLSTLVGRARIRVSGATNRVEPAVAWAERRRFPPQLERLGGISGGPALDLEGRVVGVTVGSSPRRGTVITAAPVSLREVIRQAGVNLGPDETGRRAAPSASRLTAFGDDLRRDFSVAKVICLLRPPARRPLSRR